MKKIILILVTSIFTVSGFAQQFPLQSQYRYNYSSINPAAVGAKDYFSIRASARNQWVNFGEKDISTEYITFTNGFGNSGVGLTMMNDETGGFYSSTGFKLAYSHKVIVSESEFYFGSHRIAVPQSELFLGISGGGSKYNSIDAVNDAVVSTGKTPFVPDASFGVYYRVKDLCLGVSVPGILNSNIEVSESNNNVVESHLYSMVSYTKKINDFWKLEPAVLMKTTEEYNQFDFNMNVKFREQVWFGTSFRSDYGPSIYVGLDFGRLFSIYSHDIATNKMSNYSNGTHELTIGYDFRPLTEDELNARKKRNQVLDTDGDGVVDSLDLCPNLAGSVDAHGCPDFDMDGVPDQYDLCPKLPGDIEAGCPDLTDMEKEIIRDVIENLRFEVGSAKIQQESYQNLARLTLMLKQNPGMYLEIHGHTSAEGSSSYNLGLSQRRAKSVEQFFLSRGISPDKLLTRFYGENNPLNNNLTESQRSQNRRVEFSVIFHLSNREEVISIERQYADALRNANIADDRYNYLAQPRTETNNGLNITRGNNDIVITRDLGGEIITDPVLNDPIIIEPKTSEPESIIKQAPKSIVEKAPEPVVKEEVAKEGINDNVSNNKSDYLLVVGTFSNETNAKKFISDSGENLNYKKLGVSYYVYAYSSPYREDVAQFRSVYKNCNGCWIK